MKKALFLFLTFLYSISTIQAQECSKFYPLSTATEFQITSYNKKNKVVAVIDYNITEVNQTATGENAVLKNIIKDDKGDIILESTVEMNCENGVLAMDFKSMVSPEIYEQFGQMDITLSGNNLVYPNNLTTGDNLADADVALSIDFDGIPMNMNVNVFDRKVIGKETITTPAGTFDCYVITFTTEMKTVFKFKGTSKQWIAEGVGMVQQEDYNKKGKLIGVSKLTALKK